MIKRKISKMSASDLEKAQMYAAMSLEAFIDFIHVLDPELKPSEAIIIAGFILHQLPDLFKQNPELVERFKGLATATKLKRSNNSN